MGWNSNNLLVVVGSFNYGLRDGWLKSKALTQLQRNSKVAGIPSAWISDLLST